MKNVLIVDDEPLIAKGVAALLTTLELPIIISDIVFDSEEAIQICQEKKIDLIITDINMPGLNGIELIKILKKKNANLQIIILTGYGTLTFAKEAMALGVKYFLEKPVIPQTLLEALQNSIEASEQRQLETSLYQKRQVESFINSRGETPLPDTLHYPLHLYLFDSKYYYQFSRLLESYPSRNELMIGHIHRTGYIIHNNPELCLKRYLQSILDEPSLGKGVVIICTVECPDDFLKGFQLGKNNLDKEFYFDCIQVIGEKEILKEKIYENHFYLEFREELLQLIEEGKITEGKTLIKSFFSNCRKSLYPVQLLRLQVNELLTVLLESFPLKRDELFEDYSLKTMLLTDWKELQFLLIHSLDLLRDYLSNSENLKLSQKVNLIIEEYYHQETLSLKWIADRLLYLNSEYIGKTYFKETGIRFNQKLAEYRIDKAKEFLRKNYKVYEVASMVGYGNAPEYFVQIFKKNTGTTPKQFTKTAAFAR